MGKNASISRGTYRHSSHAWQRLVDAGEITPEPPSQPAPRVRVNLHVPGVIAYALLGGGVPRLTFSDGSGRDVRQKARTSANAPTADEMPEL